MVPMRKFLRNFIGLIALFLTLSVNASVGDRSYKFALCRSSCAQDTCRNHRPLSITDDTIVIPDPLPWYLIMFGWTCESNCEYHCTHRITNEALKRVQDIKMRVTNRVKAEQRELILLNERWKLQLEADLEKDVRLREACGALEFLGPSGKCLPRLASPPPGLKTDSEIRRQIEAEVARELAKLPVIDKRTVQYFGKWPQLRVLGMQEPMSAVFSFMNLCVQIYAMKKLFRERLPLSFPLSNVYRSHVMIAAVAWIASTVFHTRDLWWTERFDYFSAAAVLMSGLFMSLCRIFQVLPRTPLFSRLLSACVGAWVLHVLYLLSNRRMDYTYNMTVCLAVGVIHNLLWIMYARMPRMMQQVRVMLMRLAHDHSHAHSKAILSPKQCRSLELLVLLMFVAPALELFDFPPLFRLLDAHALWHCATVPLSWWWYHWLVEDAHECLVTHAWCIDQHDTTATEFDELHTPTLQSDAKSTAATSALPVSMQQPIVDTTSIGQMMPSHLTPYATRVHEFLRSLRGWTRNIVHSLRTMFISP